MEYQYDFNLQIYSKQNQQQLHQHHPIINESIIPPCQTQSQYLIQKFHNFSNVESALSQDTTRNSVDHIIIDLDNTKHEEYINSELKNLKDTLNITKTNNTNNDNDNTHNTHHNHNHTNLFCDSYLECTHLLLNLKDGNNNNHQDIFNNNDHTYIYEYCDQNGEIKTEKYYQSLHINPHYFKTNLLLNLEPIYMITDKDTGQVYDARLSENQKNIVMPNNNNQIKLNHKPWAMKSQKIRKNNEKLWDAIEKGNLEMIMQLLDDKKQLYKPDINSKLIDDWTALHLAVNEGHFQICQYLLMKKANVEAKTTMNRTPLHISCLRGKLSIAKLLIESGANVNAIDRDSNTPLHFVSERGYSDIVKFLMDYKADYTIKNYAGLTPIDILSTIEIKKIYESYGIVIEDENNFNKRIIMDDMTLYLNRVDMITKMLYTINMKKKTEKKKKPLNLLSKSKKKQEYKLYRRNTIINIVNFGNNLRSSNKFKSTFSNHHDLQESVGPHSFNTIALLGRGSFGRVFLVEKITNQKRYAMKILRKDYIVKHNLIRYAQTEKNILSVMEHPFIVKLNYAFQTDTYLYLVLDFCPGGDLGKLITKKKKLTEDISRIYAAEMILGLEALHHNDIVYRDLKPDNVVIDAEGHVLLTDFGLAKEGINTNLTGSFCGSVAYLAPEMLKRSGHNRTVDWYLLGVIIYEMITGEPPFFDTNRDKMFSNIEKAELKIPKGISIELKDLLIGLLKRDPSKRIGAKNDATEIKSHSWFKDINWDDVYNKKLHPPLPEIRDHKIPLNYRRLDDILPFMNTGKDYIEDWTFIYNEEDML